MGEKRFLLIGPDKNIIDRCVDKNRQAFNELAAMYSKRLYAFIHTILDNHAAADDVIQETFVRAYLNIDKFNPDDNFTQWIFTIAYRLSMNHLKSESKRKRREIQYEECRVHPAAEKSAVEKHVLENERSLEITQAVQTLSPKQKTAIGLFAFEDLSIKEIAGVMACSQGAVMSHLHRARQALREKLGSDYAHDARSSVEG